MSEVDKNLAEILNTDYVPAVRIPIYLRLHKFLDVKWNIKNITMR